MTTPSASCLSVTPCTSGVGKVFCQVPEGSDVPSQRRVRALSSVESTAGTGRSSPVTWKTAIVEPPWVRVSPSIVGGDSSACSAAAPAAGGDSKRADRKRTPSSRITCPPVCLVADRTM